MWTTGCAVRSTGGLLGEGQTLEGGFEQTGLTTESRWGHHPTCGNLPRSQTSSALPGPMRLVILVSPCGPSRGAPGRRAVLGRPTDGDGKQDAVIA